MWGEKDAYAEEEEDAVKEGAAEKVERGAVKVGNFFGFLFARERVPYATLSCQRKANTQKTERKKGKKRKLHSVDSAFSYEREWD